MNKPPIDFSFVYELSGDDSKYVYDVITLFLSSIPEKILELETLVRNVKDYTLIEERAHFLKSSSSVINIRDMYADLVEIEALARSRSGMDVITERLNNLLANFHEAMPVLLEEQEKNNPANR